MCEHMHVSVCAYGFRCPQRQEGCVRYPGSRVTGNCELSDMGVETKLGSFVRVVYPLNH